MRKGTSNLHRHIRLSLVEILQSFRISFCVLFRNPPPPFSAYMMNARSVRNRVAEIRHYIVDNDADMLIIIESWLSLQYNVAINRLVPDGYKIKPQARENRRGGGVAILYKSTVSVDIKRQGMPSRNSDKMLSISWKTIYPRK